MTTETRGKANRNCSKNKAVKRNSSDSRVFHISYVVNKIPMTSVEHLWLVCALPTRGLNMDIIENSQ